MTTGYREQALRCPACAAWLEPKHVGGSIIDACQVCGGLWVDWFDGELTAVARQAPERGAGDARAAGGDSACPRCRRPLEAEQYLETAAEVLRCGDCSGAFVSGVMLGELMRATPTESPAPKGALARLVEALRGWLRPG